MVFANFSFSLDKFVQGKKKPALCQGVSYQIFVISDTKISNTPESHLYLCQYLFCKSKNP